MRCCPPVELHWADFAAVIPGVNRRHLALQSQAMSTTLVVLALVTALLCVPTVAGMTAWGLAGGDGSPETPIHGALAVLVGGGSLYNALTCYLRCV